MIEPHSKRALVTMAIGRVPFAERSIALMRRWAAREGWAFHVIDERKIRHNPNWPRRRYGTHLEKFQLHDLLGAYDRVLYLDADILVSPATPDPFSIVAAESVGGVWDDTSEDAWKREEELNKLAQRHGPLPARSGPRFFNAGMLVLSAAHRDLWRFDKKAFLRGRWPDQSLLNYRILTKQVPVTPLPIDFNLMPVHAEKWASAEQRRRAFLVHYAGQPAKPTMAEDLPFFEAAWAQADQGEST